MMSKDGTGRSEHRAGERGIRMQRQGRGFVVEAAGFYAFEENRSDALEWVRALERTRLPARGRTSRRR